MIIAIIVIIVLMVIYVLIIIHHLYKIKDDLDMFLEKFTDKDAFYSFSTFRTCKHNENSITNILF